MDFDELKKDPEYIAYMEECKRKRTEIAISQGKTYEQASQKAYEDLTRILNG